MTDTKKKKKGGVAALVIGLIAVVLAAAVLVMWLLFVFAGGQLISRSETHVDLNGAGIKNVKMLLRLTGPEEMDLRGNSLSAEDVELVKGSFPQCQVLWDVPVGGEGESFDCLSETVAPSAFSSEQAELYRHFPNLREVDLRAASMSAEDFELLKSILPQCSILWSVPVAGGRYDCSSVSLRPENFEMSDSENWRYFTALTELDLRMMDVSIADYEALQAVLPQCNIRWSVNLDEKLLLDNDATGVSLSDAGQTDALLAAAEIFGGISEIDVGYTNISPEHFEGLRTAFPEAQLNYSIEIAGNTVSSDVEKLDLSSVSAADVDEVIELMSLLPNVSEAELMNASGESVFSLDDALKIQAACPGLKLNYSFELFGKKLSTDMERVEYKEVEIGDEGLEEFRKVLPMMHGLSYLLLDSCGTSDEAMAQLRDEFPDVKIVWKISVGYVELYTDTLRIWTNDGFLTNELYKLKYCTDVRYMDVGHMMAVTDLEWARHMPDLEVLIVAMTGITDISPLVECKKLEFLEIFTNEITDLGPLAELENLEYLNISNMPITDISPIFGLEKLKMVNCNMCQTVPQEQIDEFKELHPDTVFNYVWYINPKGSGWNYDEYDSPTERYSLLRRQIGYGTAEPPGYITEPIS